MREVVHKTVLFLYFVTTLAPLFDYLFNNIRDFLPFLCFFEGSFSLYTSAQYKSLYDTFFEGKSKPWFHTKVLFALNLIEWVKDNIAHRDPHHFCTTSDVCVFNANKNQWALHILWGSNIKKQINSMFH